MASTGYNSLINRRQPSSSGHIMEVSTGCAIHDFNIAASTAGSTAIKNHGVTVINTTHVRLIETPTSGCEKTLIFHGTTKAMVVRTIGATINNSTDDVLQVTLTSATGKHKGFTAKLYGLSTAKWYMGVEANLVGLKLSSST